MSTHEIAESLEDLGPIPSYDPAADPLYPGRAKR